MRSLALHRAAFLFVIFLVVPATAQTIPSNTAVFVRIDQALSSQNAKRNQRVKASIAENVMVHGNALIPKGARAAVFVSKVRAGGSVSGRRAVLLLRLDAVTVGGRAYPISAHYAEEHFVPPASTPANAGVTGATGTPVKASATGRRTAASGGAAAGTENAGTITPQGITVVSFPTGTVLSFRLESPIRLK